MLLLCGKFINSKSPEGKQRGLSKREYNELHIRNNECYWPDLQKRILKNISSQTVN